MENNLRCYLSSYAWVKILDFYECNFCIVESKKMFEGFVLFGFDKMFFLDNDLQLQFKCHNYHQINRLLLCKNDEKLIILEFQRKNSQNGEEQNHLWIVLIIKNWLEVLRKMISYFENHYFRKRGQFKKLKVLLFDLSKKNRIFLKYFKDT